MIPLQRKKTDAQIIFAELKCTSPWKGKEPTERKIQVVMKTFYQINEYGKGTEKIMVSKVRTLTIMKEKQRKSKYLQARSEQLKIIPL